MSAISVSQLVTLAYSEGVADGKASLDKLSVLEVVKLQFPHSSIVEVLIANGLMTREELK